eukprot:COSAG01_NODE_19523_length_1005_cov_1.032009_2_plen_186_part_00
MSGEEARLRQQVSILQRKLENQTRQHEYDEEDRLQEAAAKAREQAATLAQAGAICINPSQPCAYDGAPSRSISYPHADFALSCRRSCRGCTAVLRFVFMLCCAAWAAAVRAPCDCRARHRTCPEMLQCELQGQLDSCRLELQSVKIQAASYASELEEVPVDVLRTLLASLAPRPISAAGGATMGG